MGLGRLKNLCGHAKVYACVVKNLHAKFRSIQLQCIVLLLDKKQYSLQVSSYFAGTTHYTEHYVRLRSDTGVTWSGVINHVAC